MSESIKQIFQKLCPRFNRINEQRIPDILSHKALCTDYFIISDYDDVFDNTETETHKQILLENFENNEYKTILNSEQNSLYKKYQDLIDVIRYNFVSEAKSSWYKDIIFSNEPENEDTFIFTFSNMWTDTQMLEEFDRFMKHFGFDREKPDILQSGNRYMKYVKKVN